MRFNSFPGLDFSDIPGITKIILNENKMAKKQKPTKKMKKEEDSKPGKDKKSPPWMKKK